MAGYTRQSTFADGDTITAALFNNEYNQLVNAFSNTTGHSHDGTAASGPVIGLIGDAGETSPNNKVLIDTTNNYIEFYVEVSSAPVQQLYIADGAIIPVTDSDVDLGTSSLYFKDAYIDSITTTGNVSVGGNLTVTGTTTFNGGTLTLGDAADDNVVFGADVNSNIIPNTDNTYDLGSSSQEWKDLYVDGIAYLDGINFNGTAITATAAELNILDGVTSTAAELNILDGVTATTAEINLLDGVTSTTAELNILDGVTATATEINLLDGVTSTTAELNILDGVTATAAEINLLDGVTATTAELNILDGVTSTATELNLLDGVTSTTAELNILDGVTSTTAELNLLDGVTATTAELNYVDVATAGTVEASKAIVVDSNKDFTGARNVTITGELDAATLDISGDADIDGTLEADAITIGGVTLAETISDTVGAMVSSNTETNITVTYDDTDNTLDFVIGTLNQDTTGNAATATALETARTIHGVSFDGTANIDLTEVVQDTVGAMFTSNTESGITVAYQDADGTVDFTVGTLNQDTTGNAATATALETARTIGGTSFDGTANIAVNLSATATALATARTIGGVSFDGTANIVPTTFNAATFSGDLNVDSGVLFADVSTNRVGINQTTPDVSLDLGANTDAIHVPVGTTAQRPSSPAAGYFRYNTTTSKFEGYTDEWGAIAGGGSGTNMDTNIYAGDGSTVNFTLSTAPDTENNLMVFIDGVFQAHDSYSVSGTTLTFSTAPASGRVITAYHSTTTVGGSNYSIATMTGDGSDTTLTLSTAPVHENNVQVYFDGVYQSKSNYSISGTTVTFTTAPPSGVTVEAITATNTSITTATQLVDADSDTMIQVEESSDEDKIRFDTGGTERMIIDSTGVGIGTSSPSTNLSIFNSSPAWNQYATLRLASENEAAYYGEVSFHRGTSDDTDRGLVFNLGGTERMRILNSGKVGIGKTPQNTASLDVNGSIIATGQNIGTFTFDQVGFDYNTTSKEGRLFATASGGSGGFLSITTGNNTVGRAERMRILNTGQLVLGGTSNTNVSGNADDLIIGSSTNSTERGVTIASTTGGGIRWNDGADSGVIQYSHSSNEMYYSSASHHRFIGNVGIAQSSPSQKLDIFAAADSGFVKVGNNNGSVLYGVNTAGNAFVSGQTSGKSLIFETNNTEGMRIDSSGHVMVGTTTITPATTNVTGVSAFSDGRLHVSAQSQTSLFVNRKGTDGTAVEFRNDATIVGSISVASASTAYNTSSDARLKDVTGEARGLEVINELNPVSYNWKADGKADEGLIAQEVQKIVPNAVSGSEEEMYQMDYSKLVVHLVKAVKEQQAQIEELKKQLENK